ncbi:hypothetical protein QBC38DRAFT_451964 [Podospora fimiseda]|uniref:Uncharacterized protein n=1 Tax=Podospora fimiseda TaxID=252190 RepID=A0AAN7BX99_9PEZI|nr:hypothetical protein QBC38DRAFT_451964 [Podospora fimiseda]
MTRKNKSYKLRQAFYVKSFNEYFGSGTLEDWQRLCTDLGLEGQDFRSKTKCRNAIKTINVNIWDLVDAVIHKDPKEIPQRFHSRRALIDYTLRTKRIFPLDAVKDEMGPVRALLRQIF